jgi:hypothetical protein
LLRYDRPAAFEAVAVRLWSLHPKYLDPQGLVALQGGTRGYRSHPQLERFRAQGSPLAAIGSYLFAVSLEASARGYSFDDTKIAVAQPHHPVLVTDGQLRYEWQHLLGKLAQRNVELHLKWSSVKRPECHPLFKIRRGDVEAWERLREPS